MNFNEALNIFYIGSGVAILALFIILLIMIHLENKEEKVEPVKEVKEEVDTLPDIDLTALTKELENRKAPDRIELTSYEEEQEKTAIISYEELVNTAQMEQVNYTEELDLDGLSVKTIDMNNLVSTMEPKPIKVIKTEEVEESKAIPSYEKEEAFLETLQRIQSLLN